ncbi:hypothetical protein Tco_1129440 [Tanacetum coccineum]
MVHSVLVNGTTRPNPRYAGHVFQSREVDSVVKSYLISEFKQPMLSRSSAEAEYHGVANAVAETCFGSESTSVASYSFIIRHNLYCDNGQDTTMRGLKQSDIYLFYLWGKYKRSSGLERAKVAKEIR